MDSEKLINSFEMRNRMDYLVFYWMIIFTNSLITFRHYYYYHYYYYGN